LYSSASANRFGPSANANHINCPSASSRGINILLLESVESKEKIEFNDNPFLAVAHPGISFPSNLFSSAAVTTMAAAEATKDSISAHHTHRL
jgi:hypothetical protein